MKDHYTNTPAAQITTTPLSVFSFKLGEKEAQEDLYGGYIPEGYMNCNPADVRNFLEMDGHSDEWIDGYIVALQEDKFFEWNQVEHDATDADELYAG